MTTDSLQNAIPGVAFIAALFMAAVFALPAVVGWVPLADFIKGIVIGGSLLVGILTVVGLVIFVTTRFMP
jgi:hypothetical protein